MRRPAGRAPGLGLGLLLGAALLAGAARAQTIGPIANGPYTLPLLGTKAITYSNGFNGSGPALIRVTLSAPNVLTTSSLTLNGTQIKRLRSRSSSYRSIVLGFSGALVAALPRIALAAFGGQGWWALLPQLDFLPFAVAGALFALVLDHLVRVPAAS